MTFWMCVIATVLLISSVILAATRHVIWSYITLAIGEILAIIYAFPIVISDILSK